MAKGGRFIRTVAHLRPAQVWARAGVGARRLWWRVNPAHVQCALRSRARRFGSLLWDSPHLRLYAVVRRERASLRPSVAERVLEGEFVLTNRVFRFDGRVPWRPERSDRMSRLQAFELHYQAYLEDLALAWVRTGDGRYVARWLELATGWMRSNPAGNDGFAELAWSPYVTAERVRNWLSCLHWLRGRLPLDAMSELEHSLALQTAFLADNLERHLDGNHLAQNLCGLAVSACFWSGAEPARLQARAVEALARVVERQLLADGMHQERSFAYHVKLLIDLLEVLSLAERMPAQGGAVQRAAARIRGAVGRMAGLVASTCEELGELPLFNDTVVLSPQVVRWATAQAERHTTLVRPGLDMRARGSGYLVGTAGPWAAVFDAGPAGPPHQMGHAHADHLGFELWHKGSKVVCDSGNATYQEGPKRLWYRGTAAHSTVRLDGQDSLELWKAFRVGRRPARNRCSVLACSEGELCWCGQHDGYRALVGHPVHRRWFAATGEAVQVLDELEGSWEHRVESFLHFAPGVRLTRLPQDVVLRVMGFVRGGPLRHSGMLSRAACCGWAWRAPPRSDGFAVALWPAAVEMSVAQQTAPFAPSFCVELERPSLRLAGRARLPLRLGWLLVGRDARRAS